MQGSSLGQEPENQKQSTPTEAANILADSDGYLDLGSLIDLPVDIAKPSGSWWRDGIIGSGRRGFCRL